MLPLFRVAVLLPCYNEDATVARVVNDFRIALPEAAIYVGDNNSTDNSVVRAQEAGAEVVSERLQGKGNVLRRMFADIDADIYVIADADATYDATAAPQLVAQLISEGLDFVNASRVPVEKGAYRRGHHFGNRILSGIVSIIFGSRVDDMLSGYKVLSRRFVKSFPALASGFETETELLVHALELRMPLAEIETSYFERPPESLSKLRTLADGFRILVMIVKLIREERPLPFFLAIFTLFLFLTLILGVPVIWEFLETGLVPRLPTALLATGLMLLAFISLACGLIVDMITHMRREIKRLHYLSLAASDSSYPSADSSKTIGHRYPNGTRK